MQLGILEFGAFAHESDDTFHEENSLVVDLRMTRDEAGRYDESGRCLEKPKTKTKKAHKM